MELRNCVGYGYFKWFVFKLAQERTIAVMLDLEKAFDSPLMISLKANNSALREQVE